MAKSDLLIRIGTDLKALGKGLGDAETKLRRFGFKAERIGSDLTTRISLPLVALGGIAVKTFAEFDRLEKGLSALNGSAAGGAASFNRLNKIVLDTRTTLDLKTAALGAQRLQGAGLSAAFAERTIKALGVTATFSGSAIDDVGGVMRQFTQIIGKGKIEQEDLNTIFDRMTGLGKIVREEFGTQTAEGIRATGISMEAFVARTVGAIEASEEIQGVQGGLAKAFESFGNAVQTGIRPLGEAIAKALNLEQNLQRLGEFVGRASQAFADLNPNIQKFIVFTAAGAAAIGPLFLGLGAVAKALPLLKSGIAILIGPIGSLVKGVSFLASTTRLLFIGGALGRAVVFTKVLTGLKAAFAVLTGPIGVAVAVIAAIGIGFVKAYKNSEFFRNQISRLGEALKPIKTAIASLAAKFLPNLSGAFTSLGSVFNGVFSVVGAGISAIIESFILFIENATAIGNAISKLFSGDFSGAADELAKSALNPAVFIKQAKRVGNAFSTTFNETLAGNVSVAAVSGSEDVSTGGGGLDGATGGGGSGRNVPAAIKELSTAATELSKKAREEVGAFFNEFVVGSSNIDFLEGKLANLSALPVTIGQPDLLQRQKDIFKEIGEEIQGNLGAAFEETDAKARFFGEGFSALSEKITLTKEALQELYENGFSPTDEIVIKTTETLAELELKQDSVTEKFGAMASAMEALKGASTTAFDAVSQAMSKGESAVKAFGNAVLASVRDAISAEIKLAVATQVASALRSVPFPFNVGLAAAAGAGASALFNSALSAVGIPALADGAVTTGPQLALIGEAGPEAVIPLNRYENLIRAGEGGGNGGGGPVEFVIRGEDLVGLMRSATPNYNRS